MKAPKIPSFIRLNQHDTYKGTYRFFDPRKERLEKLKERYGDQAPAFDSDFKGRWDRTRRVKKTKDRSSARVLIIFIFLLLLVALWMLKSDMFERMVTSFINM